MDGESEVKCPVPMCGKDLSLLNLSNKEKHISACQRKYDIKKQKDKKPFKSNLHNYFNKKQKLDINEKQSTGTDDVLMQEEHFIVSIPESTPIMNSEVPTVSPSPTTSCTPPTSDVIMSNFIIHTGLVA